jgi:hypothetical protein
LVHITNYQQEASKSSLDFIFLPRFLPWIKFEIFRKMTTTLSEQELESALRELKECTMATKETVGVRCARRVNTTLFKQGLSHLKGDDWTFGFVIWAKTIFHFVYEHCFEVMCAIAVVFSCFMSRARRGSTTKRGPYQHIHVPDWRKAGIFEIFQYRES